MQVSAAVKLIPITNKEFHSTEDVRRQLELQRNWSKHDTRKYYNHSPMPPARVDKRKTGIELSLLNLSMRSCRSDIVVWPSRRRKVKPMVSIRQPSKSRHMVHWENMSILWPSFTNFGNISCRKFERFCNKVHGEWRWLKLLTTQDLLHWYIQQTYLETYKLRRAKEIIFFQSKPWKCVCATCIFVNQL